MTGKPAASSMALLLFVIVVSAACSAAPQVKGKPQSQVLVEAGWTRPGGDLSRDYTETKIGFGAGDGLEIGFRWRYYLSRTVSLSPAFHFVDYRDFKSSDAEIGDYRVSASSLRYTLELMMIRGTRDSPARPFAALSGGLYRNRAVGYNKALTEPFDQSVNSLGLGLRAGVRMSDFEISAIYHFNRLSTWSFFPTGQEQDYDWDSFSVRAAWIIPFSDNPKR